MPQLHHYKIVDWMDKFTVQKKIGMFFHSVRDKNGDLKVFKNRYEAKQYIKKEAGKK